MGEAYLGEIFMGGWNFNPKGFQFCNGQLLPISQNSALFSLLGTNYGGDGQTTFALPDLRGRVPIHWGQGLGLSQYVIGEQMGAENITLTQSQMPAHNHLINVNRNLGTTNIPASNTYMASGPATGSGPNVTFLKTFTTDNTNGALATLNPSSESVVGGSQPHNNIQPGLSITFVIAMQGIFPSRS
jgi:microcystin-dependent protein